MPNNIHALLLNLFTVYGNIMTQQLNAKREEVERMDYLIEYLIDDVFNVVEDLQELGG